MVRGLRDKFGAKADVDLLMGKQFPFAVSMNPTGERFYRKGRTAPDVSIGYSATKGGKSVTPQWQVSKDGTLVQNPGNPIVLSKVAASTKVTIIGVYEGETKNAGTFTMTFVNPKYFAIVAANFTPTVDTVSAAANEATDSLNNKKVYAKSDFALNNQKVMYAYPKAFGDLKYIYDQNGFDIFGGFTKSVMAINGEDYNVYVSNNAATNDGLAYEFTDIKKK